MKVTETQIREYLAKVFASTEKTAQYNSTNEMYDCICGWCGTMSPLSRPAFIKEFGAAVTAEAERGARADLEAWRAEYEASEWAARKAEADAHEADGQPCPVEGCFVWGLSSGLKCDGGRGYMDEMENHYFVVNEHGSVSRSLLHVERVVRVSADELDRNTLADELAADGNLPGGSYYEDSEHLQMGAPYALNYTRVVAVTDGLRYYYIDSEGVDYARYIYFGSKWKEFFAIQYESYVRMKDAEKSAEEKRQMEDHAASVAAYAARCKKWESIMQPVAGLELSVKALGRNTREGKSARRKLHSTRRANILAMCGKAFPGVKFSLTKHDGWGEDWVLSYTDGPTEKHFEEAVDLDLFTTHWDTFDGMTDCADVMHVDDDFCDFARLYMGASGTGGIKVERDMSDNVRGTLRKRVLEVVPEMDGDNGGRGFLRNDLPASMRSGIGSLIDWTEFNSNWVCVGTIVLEMFEHTDYYTSPASPSVTKKKVVQESARVSSVLTVGQYSERAIVVRGYSDAQYKELVELGGRYNRRLKGGPGIIFSKKRGDAVTEYITAHSA